MKLIGTDVGNKWTSHAMANVGAFFRWIVLLLKAILTATFVQPPENRKIEESRELVRRYLMRS